MLVFIHRLPIKHEPKVQSQNPYQTAQKLVISLFVLHRGHRQQEFDNFYLSSSWAHTRNRNAVPTIEVHLLGIAEMLGHSRISEILILHGKGCVDIILRRNETPICAHEKNRTDIYLPIFFNSNTS